MSGFDVVVVGGGHAGCEAALAADRLGGRVLLINAWTASIATLPCNPSIGGPAKSHLVFELDALGGSMAENADATGIHFRVLNAARGPAVQAHRVQCDKAAYALRMQHKLQSSTTLTVLEDEVLEVVIENTRVVGVRARNQGMIKAKSVILTTGTALGGRIHVGDREWAGAGDQRQAADPLAQALRTLGLPLRRLKTGTPPRLDAESIDWSSLTAQPSDQPTPFLSWWATHKRFHVEPFVNDLAGMIVNDGTIQSENIEFEGQRFHVEPSPRWRLPPPGTDLRNCYTTQTQPVTHAIIRKNLKASARYGGYIQATGVRYCPSIEDKIVKFPDRDHHQVYLEPEGRHTRSIYVNGLSNSFPESVQADLVHSLPGLSRAKILQYGYAIVYDCIDPRCLKRTLEVRDFPGLFCAGQINGTTGYEEAAAQGFVAGVNAARGAQEQPEWILERHEAYIGVLIDDLTTKGTDEPYRMFTSRAERRLWLRQDNARFRLATHARNLGLIFPDFLAETEIFAQQTELEIQRLSALRGPGGANGMQILCRDGMRYAAMSMSRRDLDPVVVRQVEIQARYAGYLAQEEQNVVRARNEASISLPSNVDYRKIPALRVEAREKLEAVQPENLGRAGRIPGVNPADVAVLSVLVRRGAIPRRRLF